MPYRSGYSAYRIILIPAVVFCAKGAAWANQGVSPADQGGLSPSLPALAALILILALAAVIFNFIRWKRSLARITERIERSYNGEVPEDGFNGEGVYPEMNRLIRALEIFQKASQNRQTDVCIEKDRADGGAEIGRIADSDELNTVGGEILANITHEIRTPLNAITGLVDTLQRTALTPSQKDYLNNIHKAAQSLLLVSNSILDFSALNSGKNTFENKCFHINRILENVFKTILPETIDKDIEFSIRSSARVPRILFGEPAQIEKVLICLTQNAVKFTEKGFVSVDVDLASTDEDSSMLRFSVKDTGIGMPQDKAEQLFKPFIQGDGSSTRKYGGVGLGLALSKRYVEMMGGELKTASMPVNGTEFYFTLPLWAPSAEQIENDLQFSNLQVFKPDSIKVEQDLSAEKIKNARVLLVEDDSISQEIEMDILQGVGLNHIDIKSGGKHALEALKSNQYDIVLMDIEMEPMNGYETTKAIREWEMGNRTGSNIPIVALTAHNGVSDIQRCLETGMNDYVAKPIEPNRLLMVFDSLLPEETSDSGVTVLKASGETIFKKPGTPTGIDMNRAISRFGGNREAFYSRLMNFSEKYEYMRHGLRKDLEAGNIKQVMEQLHVIQGVAGNLSALRIVDSAKKLKSAIVDEKAEFVTFFLAEFEGALAEVVDSVLVWKNVFNGGGDPAGDTGDAKERRPFKITEEVRRMIEDLDLMLERNSLNAEEIIENLFPAIQKTEFENEFRLLEKQAGLLEFKTARQTLNGIRERMESEDFNIS